MPINDFFVLPSQLKSFQSSSETPKNDRKKKKKDNEGMKTSLEEAHRNWCANFFTSFWY